LGIVVDDAIVVGETIYFHRKQGEPPIKAAVEGACEVGMPVIPAVTTSIVTLLLLFYIVGIMGKFISIMPAVVIACLTVSLLECLMLLPAHLSHLPNPGSKNNSLNPLTRKLEIVHHLTSSGMEWFVAHVFTPFLSKALYWRYISLCVAVSILLNHRVNQGRHPQV
jgi:multidrug efflux pump subunit AcrB